MKLQTLIAELKRRNVFKVATIYAVTAWLVIQISTTIFPQFEMSQWTIRAVILLCAIGFPIALVLAWAYEVVPEGETARISDESVNQETEAKPVRSKWLNARWMMSVGLLGLLGITFFFFKKDLTSIAFGVPPMVITDKSIAVLPFRDLSPNKDQEYLSDGMMVAILDRLIQVKELQTRSERAVLSYKDSEKTLTEIGKELAVTYILEGNVQRFGEQLRISVRLVDAKNEQPLWANQYDGQFSSIFDFQNKIANEIASNLNISIAPEVKQVFEKKYTPNPEAYTKYLQGYNAFWRNGNNYKATELFEEAINLDPEYAAPYAELAFMWMGKGIVTGGLNRPIVLEKVQPLLQKAKLLDPDDVRVNFSQNQFNFWFMWDFKAAEQGWKKLSSMIDLANGEYAANYTDFLNTLGKHEEALVIGEKAKDNDPSNGWSWGAYIKCLAFAGRTEEALKNVDIAYKLFGGSDFWAKICVYAKNYEKAIFISEELLSKWGITDSFGYPRMAGYLAIAYYHTGNDKKVKEILNWLIEVSNQTTGGSPRFHIAMIYAQMGEKDLAFQWIEKAIETHEVEVYWLMVEPPFEPLRDDPRWEKMLEKVGFPKPYVY